MDEKVINARCPSCGGDFSIERVSGTVVCPSCGKECSALQAVKYYESVASSQTTAREAHGDDYHKVMLLIDESSDLCSAGDFDAAEKKVEEALALTETDYRAYMAMVEVKTKAYTDYADQSHTEYLNKAIAVADVDGRADIKRIYKPYYEKSRFTDEELDKYNQEVRKDKKNKLEKLLKSMIPSHMASEKNAWIFLLVFPLCFALGIAGFFLSFVFDEAWIALIGAVAMLCGYVFFRVWFNGRERIKAFNSTLDLYDVLESVELTDENAVKLYSILTDIADRFSLNNPPSAMVKQFDELINLIIEINDDKLNEFVIKDAFFGKMVESED